MLLCSLLPGFGKTGTPKHELLFIKSNENKFLTARNFPWESFPCNEHYLELSRSCPFYTLLRCPSLAALTLDVIRLLARSKAARSKTCLCLKTERGRQASQRCVLRQAEPRVPRLMPAPAPAARRPCRSPCRCLFWCSPTFAVSTVPLNRRAKITWCGISE